MQVIGSIILVFLVVVATANALSLAVGGLLDEKKPPFAKDDPVEQIVPQLTTLIRERISGNLANDTAAQTAVKDAPIEVLSYRSQLVSGFNYFVRAKVASYFFHLSIYRNIKGETFLHGVTGPVAENALFEYDI